MGLPRRGSRRPGAVSRHDLSMDGVQTASITITRTLTDGDDLVGWEVTGDADKLIVALGMLDLVRDGMLRGDDEQA